MRKGTKKPKSTKRSSRRHVGPSADDYQVVIHWSEEDQCFIATLPAWQNVQTHGASLEAAAHNAREVVTLLVESARRHGESIPEPERQYSGNLRVRLPKSLYGRLAREAERQGVSLNQWIVARLAG